MESQHDLQQAPPERKRGRPRGQNRKPLSEEERRARNAQYERERRGEQAEASAELADAMGCDAKVKLAELLALTIMRLKRGESRNDDVRNLRMRNEELEAEIAKLETMLPSDIKEDEASFSEEEESSTSRKRQWSRDTCSPEPLIKKEKLSRHSSRSSPEAHQVSMFPTQYDTATMPGFSVPPQRSSTADSFTGTEAEDLLLSSEELVELETLINSNVFTDEIPLWSSPEDIDFKLFPPTT